MTYNNENNNSEGTSKKKPLVQNMLENIKLRGEPNQKRRFFHFDESSNKYCLPEY